MNYYNAPMARFPTTGGLKGHPVSPEHPHLRLKKGGYTAGVCDDATKTIYINEELPLSFMGKVLRHEIAHAVLFSHDVLLSEQDEELIADVVANYGQEMIDIFNRVTI